MSDTTLNYRSQNTAKSHTKNEITANVGRRYTKKRRVNKMLATWKIDDSLKRILVEGFASTNINELALITMNTIESVCLDVEIVNNQVESTLLDSKIKRLPRLYNTMLFEATAKAFGGIGLVLSDGGVTACKYRIFGFKNTTAPAMAAFQMLSEQLMQARIDFLFRLKIDDADERIAAADTFCVSFVEKLAVLMHVKNKEIDKNIRDAVFDEYELKV